MNFKRYESRFKAGEIMTDYIKEKNKDLYQEILTNPNDTFCFAIPNGGVPVAESFCSILHIEYDLFIVRKIKIPYNPEAGFGSITTDGTVLINEVLLEHLSLTEEEINNAIEQTKNEINQRLDFYDKPNNLSSHYQQKIESKKVFLIDDGLASGFTMLAAINMVKKYNPTKIYISVPTAPHRTVENIEGKVEEIFCPNIRKVLRFAVADAYKNWYDLSEEEVLEIIRSSEYYSS